MRLPEKPINVSSREAQERAREDATKPIGRDIFLRTLDSDQVLTTVQARAVVDAILTAHADSLRSSGYELVAFPLDELSAAENQQFSDEWFGNVVRARLARDRLNRSPE